MCLPYVRKRSTSPRLDNGSADRCHSKIDAPCMLSRPVAAPRAPVRAPVRWLSLRSSLVAPLSKHAPPSPSPSGAASAITRSPPALSPCHTHGCAGGGTNIGCPGGGGPGGGRASATGGACICFGKGHAAANDTTQSATLIHRMHPGPAQLLLVATPSD